MIEIKKCNYFTGDTSVAAGVNDIVNFLELAGRNYLLLTPPRNNDIDTGSSSMNSIKYYLDNQFHFNNFDEFVSVLNVDGNLFRIDLLVLDFWHLSPTEISIWKKEVDKLGLDHLIIAKEYYYKSTDDVTDYHFRREYKTIGESELFITDNINKWTATLESLIKSYRRDKKIDDIFGKSDN